MAHLHARKVLQYKERFKKEAEELLLTGFPSTILKLNTLIVNPKFKSATSATCTKTSPLS
jgi:hypothetical protein